MQFQADILNKQLLRPQVRETTALGAASLAGLATGVWSGTDELKKLHTLSNSFESNMEQEERECLLRGWHRAVERSLRWAED